MIGKYRNPETFGLEIVKKIRKRVGPDYPIMYRIDLSLALNETYGDRMNQISSLKRFRNGRTIDQTLEYMRKLVEAGVDIFDVDIGCYDNWWLPHPPAGMPAGCFLDISRIAKNYFKKNNIRSNAGLEVPVVAVGKLGYPDLAERAIASGDCDMVMLARPLLADEEWCNKAYRGDVEDIRPCIGCQEGCVNEFILGGHPQCAVNPRTGFEEVLPANPQPAEKAKKIAVIGGGPAGIAFAVTAAKRGHKVELFEKSARLGGKVKPGSVPKIKFDFENYLEYLETQVAHAEKEHGLKINLETAATQEMLKKGEYDTIVCAYGTKEIQPKFEGMDKVKTVLGIDLLENPELMGDAKRIVIVGGGVVGCEVAYWLSYEYGKDVTVVEMLPDFMTGVCTANRGHLLHYLEKNHVPLYNCTRVMGFDKNRVKVSRNISSSVPNPYNTWQPLLPPNIPNPLAKKIKDGRIDMDIPADLVVLAMGGKPDKEFFFQIMKNHIAPEVYDIGDSDRAGRILEAVRAGYRLAVTV